jgi:hypothetical protein
MRKKIKVLVVANSIAAQSEINAKNCAIAIIDPRILAETPYKLHVYTEQAELIEEIKIKELLEDGAIKHYGFRWSLKAFQVRLKQLYGNNLGWKILE